MSVQNEDALLDIADSLHYAELPYRLIHEPDLPDSGTVPPGQFTAIGLPPTAERAPIRRVLGRLPLWAPS